MVVEHGPGCGSTSEAIVDNVTTEFHGTCGIAAGYPRCINIEHNEVGHVNYTGISVGYGWTGSEYDTQTFAQSDPGSL